MARDPVLLEEISNGHAARMRYSRFRDAAEKQTKAAAAKLAQDTGAGKYRPAPPATSSKETSAPQEHGSLPKPKPKAVRATRDLRASTVSAKRGRDKDVEDGADSIHLKTEFESDAVARADGNEPSDENGLNLNLDKYQIAQAAEKNADSLLETTSFCSSLPSPPTEAVPSMEAIVLLERKKRLRKMYTFSPTMKAQTLHQIPLPRGVVPPAAMGASRVQSLPCFPTTAAPPSATKTPGNSSSVLMMRHNSAGSLNQHGQHQFSAPLSQLSLPADAGDFGLALDFTFVDASINNTCSGASSANLNNMGSNTTRHPSPWVATPFSSPLVPAFDMSPYAATLDMMGGGVGDFDGPGGDTQPLPSLFQTQFDSQQQQQQRDDFQASLMSHAFAKHGSWDSMIGQNSVGHEE